MGVKLQLLLGICLFGAVCGNENNGTIVRNVSLEKVDNAKNLIENPPKTDTHINLVNKDTRDNSDVSLKYPLDTDTHKNETFSRNDENATSDNDRRDNSRSIDFHNSDYSLDNEKYLENSIGKASTKGYLDFSNFQLTTPESKYFGTRLKKAKQKLEYEENTPEHFDDEDANDHEHFDYDFDKLFVDPKHQPNASIDYKEKTSISKNNTFNDHSEHNELSIEKVQKLSFASEYNFTTSDDTEKPEMYTNSPRDVLEVSPPRGFFTTRKPVTLTKPPTSDNNHILSNKIESDTIKAINSLTTEYSTTKRVIDHYDIVSKDQNVEENKIIPTEASNYEATEHFPSNTVINVTTFEQINQTTEEPTVTTLEQIIQTIEEPTVTTLEQIKATTKATEHTSINSVIHVTTFEQIKQTTDEPTVTTLKQMKQTTEEPTVTTLKQETEEPTVKTAEPTAKTVEPVATTENDKVTTTEYNEQISNKVEEATTLHTKDDVTEINEESTTKLNETTTGNDSKETTMITNKLETSTLEVTKQTTTTDITSTLLARDETTIPITDFSTTSMSPEDTTDNGETTEVTTESYVRISKAFSFGITPTLTDADRKTTTEMIKVKLFSQTEIEIGKTTQALTVVKNGTATELHADGFDTTTHAFVPQKTTEQETSTTIIDSTTTLYDTTPLSQSSTSDSTTAPAPKFRNATAALEDTTTTTATSSTEEYISDSSSVTDAGNVGGSEDNRGKVAAIVISTVGAVSLILLAGLLYIMRKRQKRFNYKQRCRPVSLDHYSVDNVSGYNSTRRKNERQSKRSYGNPAFDDPVAVTHPLNFPALAKFATNADDIKAEFEDIPQITAKISELPEGCETKNRYANVIPLPETRVFLQSIDSYPNSDYINANYVTGPKNTKGYYIACQGPMQNTVDDFWRMVWEQQTKVILMVTHLYENGVEKCVDYLPPSEVLDCNRLFGDFQVTLKKRDVKDKYIISNLQLKNMVSNSWREVTHFWYLGWPEKGVPTEENSLIAFLIEARSFMKSATLDKTTAANGNTHGPPKIEINPVVVHCSPGTGRTGVLIACDIAIREFEQARLVDIPKIVYRIRRDRASAVQTKEQYIFIYKVVSLYATKLTGGALDSF